MDTIEFRTHPNDRVRIKPDVTGTYLYARAYMEGWVRRQQRDELGYPLVYIEWDKKHWAYSGERDGWTMEAHFDIVKKEKQVAEEESSNKGMEEVMRAAFEKFLEDQAAKLHGDKEEESVEPTDGETYESVLEEAIEVIGESDVFYIFTVERAVAGEREALVPRVFAFMRDEGSESVPLVEATISDQAAALHAQRALAEIQEIRRKRARG